MSGLLWAAGVSAVAEHPVDDATVLLRTDMPERGVAAVDEVLAGIVEPSAVRLVEILDDGLDAWRDHAQIVEVGRRLLIRPPWLPWEGTGPGLDGEGEGEGERIVIELDPGRSWGHGAHPTTRLCLAEVERLLDEADGRELLVIDVGCGSGALSVAAAVLGATRVEAFDIDPAAVEATAANAERNGVAHRVRPHLVPLDRASDPLSGFTPSKTERDADIIVANIGAAALVDLAPNLLKHLAPNGVLVLSGVLDPPPPEVAEAYAPRAATVTTLDGWSALTL